MWIARDKNGELSLYISKPRRYKTEEFRMNSEDASRGLFEMHLPEEIFPEIIWENSPVEVFLLTKEQKEEEFNKGVKFATDLAVKLSKTYDK